MHSSGFEALIVRTASVKLDMLSNNPQNFSKLQPLQDAKTFISLHRFIICWHGLARMDQDKPISYIVTKPSYFTFAKNTYIEFSY